MTLLFRDPWIKPLSDFEAGSDSCKHCNVKFGDVEFVTSCDFCEIGMMHDRCANEHILKKHREALERKMSLHKDKPLHDYQ